MGTDNNFNSGLGNGRSGISINSNCTVQNVFSCSNNDDGIFLAANSSNNIIQNNVFGTDITGLFDLGNEHGVFILGDNNTFLQNTIALNNNGIYVSTPGGGPSDNNSFSMNSIYCNSSNGIFIESGNNNNITSPLITTTATTMISGTANISETIEVFLNDETGCTSAPCQGKTYLGTTTADGSGNWTLSGLTLNINDQVTATATDASNNTSEFSACATVTCSHPDLDPLIALYNSTNGANWTNNTGWVDGAAGTNCDPCDGSWYGVDCTGGRVTCLDLDGNVDCGVNSAPGNNLTGSLPSEIEDISELIELHLSFNQLTGSIPPEIGNLSNLQNLAIGSNQLSGEIPTEIGDLTNLIQLLLWNNLLTGSIPTEIGLIPNLRFLRLDFNQLTGTVPSSFSNLSLLEDLWLRDNNLSGNLPTEIGDLNNLIELYFQNNNFSGCFPVSYFSLCSVTNKNFSNNPLLPWQGDFDQFCATSGTEAEQHGAPCNDGDNSNNPDFINSSCICIGCPTITPTITITESSGITNNDGIICNGDDVTLDAGAYNTYNWSTTDNTNPITISPTSTTTYLVTVTDASGCTGENSTTITVENIPTASISVNPTNACQGDNITFTFSGTPNATVIYNDGTANQSTTLNGAGIATEVVTAGSTDITFTLIDVTLNGCFQVLSQSATVPISPPPTASISANPNTACQGDNITFTFTGTSNATVTYNDGTANQSTTLNGAGIATEVVIAGSTDITFTLIDVTLNGCFQVLSQSATVTISPPPTASISVNPNTVCEGENITFTFTGNADVIITAGSSDLIYSLIEAELNGCLQPISNQDAIVFVNQLPTANAGFGPLDVCGNEPTNLSGSIGGGAATASWTSNGDGTFENPSDLQTTYTPGFSDAANGFVTLTLTTNDVNGFCSPAIATIDLTVTPAAMVETDVMASTCSGTPADVVGFDLGGTSFFEWITEGDGFFDNTTDPITQYNPGPTDIANGTVNLSLIGSDAAFFCTPDTADLLLTIFENPAIANLRDSCVGNNTTYVVLFDIISGTAPLNVNGDPGTLNGTSFISEPVNLNSPYNFQVVDNNNCGIEITGVKTECSLFNYIPDTDFLGEDVFDYEICNSNCTDFCDQASIRINVKSYLDGVTEAGIVFTPNGDGKNDFFIIDNITDFPNNELFISNRWGTQVFAASPYQNDWYGQNQNGKPLPDGTYYFVIKLNIGNGKFLRGSVTVQGN